MAFLVCEGAVCLRPPEKYQILSQILNDHRLIYDSDLTSGLIEIADLHLFPDIQSKHISI